MEVMYVSRVCNLIDKDCFVAVYGDKNDLLKNGMEFNGIIYDDLWTVRKFLNGYKLKINDKIIDFFREFELNISLLRKKIKDLSKEQFKLVLLAYSYINKNDYLVLDYFDKGLIFKYKKKIVNFLKTRYKGTLIVISNDLLFMNQLCTKLIVFKNNKLVFNDEFNKIYKSNLKLDYPEIIKFIKLANKKKAKLSFTFDNKELLKDIYRSVK